MLNKEKGTAVVSAVLLCAILSCGFALAQDIRYNFVPGTNFADYKSYKWVAIKGAEQIDSMLDGQVRAAIDVELAKKGLSKTDGDKADLLVGYQTAIKQEKEFNSYTTGGYGWGRAGWYGSGGMTTTTGSTSTILIGQIAVDMYDAAAQKIIWRGLASKTIDQKAKPEKQQKNLAKAMEKLFKNYPPPVKK
jgi:hypothetical protein